MTRFNYIVKSEKGAVRSGVIESPNEDVVRNVLESKGYLILEIRDEEKSIGYNLPFLNRIGLREKSVFIRQLSTMLEAGISIGDALEVIVNQTNNKRFKDVLEKIQSKVESGYGLAKSMNDFPSVFNKATVAVVETGEATGNLPKSLDRLADELEQENSFLSKIRAAMIYPIFIFTALVVVIGIMMIYVVPQLKDMFDSAEMALPWTTQMLLSVSGFVASFWWLIIVIVTGLVYSLRLYFKTTQGQKVYSRIVLKIPIINGLVEQTTMTRFCQITSLLLGTGIPILKAIKLTADSMDNALYKEALIKASKEVERGIPFSTPLAKSGIFPPVISQMVRVGEQSGNISGIMKKLSLYYLKETDTKIKMLSSMIEPVVVIILGLGIGFVVFAILIPIYQISLGVL